MGKKVVEAEAVAPPEVVAPPVPVEPKIEEKTPPPVVEATPLTKGQRVALALIERAKG